MALKDCTGFSPARIVFNYAWRCDERGFPLDVADEIRDKYPGEYAEWIMLDGFEGAT